MDKNLPDKWIRKAIKEAINNMSVYDTITQQNVLIPCYSHRTTRDGNKNSYVLLTSQESNVLYENKCENDYYHTVILDCITAYPSTGNTGTNTFVDNICDKARELVNNLTLDSQSGLTIYRQNISFPNLPPVLTETSNTFRRGLRLELWIN